MAAPYNPPIKNEDFKIRVGLPDFSVPGKFKINPTIEAGDFKVDKDGGGFNNLTTLPTISPAGSVLVLLELSSTEMNGDVITIVGIDQTANSEWGDFILSIPTTSA